MPEMHLDRRQISSANRQVTHEGRLRPETRHGDLCVAKIPSGRNRDLTFESRVGFGSTGKRHSMLAHSHEDSAELVAIDRQTRIPALYPQHWRGMCAEAAQAARS